jgi:hypothetical protein
MSCKACYSTGTCQDCGGKKYVSTGRMTNPVKCMRCQGSGVCSQCKGRSKR